MTTTTVRIIVIVRIIFHCNPVRAITWCHEACVVLWMQLMLLGTFLGRTWSETMFCTLVRLLLWFLQDCSSWHREPFPPYLNLVCKYVLLSAMYETRPHGPIFTAKWNCNVGILPTITRKVTRIEWRWGPLKKVPVDGIRYSICSLYTFQQSPICNLNVNLLKPSDNRMHMYSMLCV